jgi:hypothetical protein
VDTYTLHEYAKLMFQLSYRHPPGNGPGHGDSGRTAEKKKQITPRKILKNQ